MAIKERIFFLWWGLLAKLVGPKLSVSGMALHNTGEYISDQIRRTGHYYELPNLLKVALVCRVKHFVDVGANIGNHTRFFASLGAKGVAFEPSSGNFQLLKKNAQGFDLHNVALGSSKGSSTLLTYSDSMGNNRLVEMGAASYDEASGRQAIEVLPLDFFEIRNVDLIKVDVEGSELEVLKGSVKTLGRTRPYIWLELHTDESLDRAGISYRRSSIVKYLEELNYKSYLELDSTNFLFCPRNKMLFKSLKSFPSTS